LGQKLDKEGRLGDQSRAGRRISAFRREFEVGLTTSLASQAMRCRSARDWKRNGTEDELMEKSGKERREKRARS